VIRELLERQGADLRHLPRAPATRAGPRGRTVKMPHGHHGANHPARQHDRQGRDRVDEPCFSVDPATLPANAAQTHVSLFDGTNCGLELTDRPAFSVQYHPRPRPAAGQPLPLRPVREPDGGAELASRGLVPACDIEAGLPPCDSAG
jgi:hypothetical protein